MQTSHPGINRPADQNTPQRQEGTNVIVNDTTGRSCDSPHN